MLLRIVNPPATPTLGRLVGRARMLAELARHSFHAASTTLSAQQSVPWYAKESLFGARGLTILVTTLCLWMADRMVLVPLKLKGRYFILHAAGNAIAVVLTWNGMVRTLLDPVHAAEGDVQIFGYCVVVAIHLYHVLAFRPLPQVEWVHHVLMISLYLPISPYISLPQVEWVHRLRDARARQERAHQQGGGEARQQRHQHVDAHALRRGRRVHPLPGGAIQEPRLR